MTKNLTLCFEIFQLSGELKNAPKVMQILYVLNQPHPLGTARIFYQKSTCTTQLNVGPCVVQICSRNKLFFL